MNETNSLALFSRGAQMLAEADTIQKSKELKSLALTAADWARRKGMGEDAIQHCRSYALEAERKMGEMLAATKLANGGDAQRTRLHRVTESPPTLKSIGISKRESSEAKRLAAMPRPVFESVRDGKKTRAAVNQEAKRTQAQSVTRVCKEGTYSSMKDLLATGHKFGTIYADPPWRYTNQGTRGATDNHYGTMTVEQICKLPIPALAADKCHLHLWTTNGFLFECPRIFEAWGFEFKSSFIWVKDQMGIGNYWRNSHEILLLAVKGGQTAISRAEQSWAQYPRGSHSSKPDGIRERVERLSPGPRLEVFGRSPVPGWVVFGNQISML